MKPVGILKEGFLEGEGERYTLLFWVHLLKNNKDKYLLFCINEYCFNNWPLKKLGMNSYIKNNTKNIASQIAYLEDLPHKKIINNLLYINVEIYTHHIGCIYKKNYSLTKENVLTKDEEGYVKKLICEYIHKLDKRLQEYYKKQLELFLEKRVCHNKAPLEVTHLKTSKTNIIYFPVLPSKEWILA